MGPVMLKKSSQQPDSRVVPKIETKKEKEIRLKKNKTEEEEENRGFKVPEEQADMEEENSFFDTKAYH
jgi:hypothetical protein